MDEKFAKAVGQTTTTAGPCCGFGPPSSDEVPPKVRVAMATMDHFNSRGRHDNDLYRVAGTVVDAYLGGPAMRRKRYPEAVVEPLGVMFVIFADASRAVLVATFSAWEDAEFFHRLVSNP